MKILVTNDDGIKAEGLKRLAEKALKYGSVTVVAPKKEQSGKSQSMGIRRAIKCKQIKDILPGVPTHYVDSTPTDCVRFARYYLNIDFDIVFSGVNNGFNLGEDIFYSGTVGAASEAAMYGKKALAFSIPRDSYEDFDKNFDNVMNFIEKNNFLKVNSLYNVNFVRGDSLGIKLTAQGSTHFKASVEKNSKGIVQRGTTNFGLEETDCRTDVCAVHNKYISVTPLNVDRTDHSVLEKLLKETK